MSNFKIDFGPEWDALKKQFRGNEAMQSIIPDVSIAILKFHNSLEQRVGAVYAAPGKLSNVMYGRSVNPSLIGNTFIRAGLQYQQKPIPLSAYPFKVEANTSSLSAVPTRIPFGDPLGFVKWKRLHVSENYLVAIKRGDYQQRTISTKFGGNTQGNIYAFGNTRGGSAFGGRIVGRYTQTWATRPSLGVKGIHTKSMRTQYGPTLAYLAQIVVNDTNDSTMNKAQDTFYNDIAKAFTNYYGK